MKYFKLILMCLLLISALSCTSNRSNNLSFQIINNSECDLDLLYVTTSNDTNASHKTGDYKLNRQKELHIDYCLNSKSDGAYRICYKFSNATDTVKKDFGYFSNGIVLDRGYVVRIYNDSIHVSSQK